MNPNSQVSLSRISCFLVLYNYFFLTKVLRIHKNLSCTDILRAFRFVKNRDLTSTTNAENTQRLSDAPNFVSKTANKSVIAVSASSSVNVFSVFCNMTLKARLFLFSPTDSPR